MSNPNSSYRDRFFAYLFEQAPVTDPPVVIAGGAAVDFEKARDVDLWIPHNRHGQLRAWFERLGITCNLPEGQLQSAYGWNTGACYGQWTLAAPWDAKPINIMTHTGTIQRMLNSWDITSHMIAITPQATIRGRFYTPLDQQPRIHLIRKGQAARTWDRYCKICERYGFGLHVGDTKKIVEALLSTADEDWGPGETTEPTGEIGGGRVLEELVEHWAMRRAAEERAIGVPGRRQLIAHDVQDRPLTYRVGPVTTGRIAERDRPVPGALQVPAVLNDADLAALRAWRNMFLDTPRTMGTVRDITAPEPMPTSPQARELVRVREAGAAEARREFDEEDIPI